MKLPQLSLRDLFWLVLACGLGLGWLVDHRQSGHREQQLRDKMEKATIMHATSTGYFPWSSSGGDTGPNLPLTFASWLSASGARWGFEARGGGRERGGVARAWLVPLELEGRPNQEVGARCL